MPKESLGKDLKQQVLEQIQKQPSAILTEHDAHPETLPETTAAQRRGLIWAGLAIAAALMLMFLANPDRDGRDPIAAADEKANSEKNTENVAEADGQAAPSFSGIESESSESLAASEGSEEFGLVEAPAEPAGLRVGEVTDGIGSVARSRAMPAESLAEVPSDEEVGRDHYLEEKEFDRSSDQRAQVAAAASTSQPPTVDAYTSGKKDRGGNPAVESSQSYEILYEGNPEDALVRFEQLLGQQGVVLRQASSDRSHRSEVEFFANESGRQVELDSWNDSQSRRELKSPRLSKTTGAAQNEPAEESLSELSDVEQGDSGEALVADESKLTDGDAMLVEATPEQVDRVLSAWQKVSDLRLKQKFSRSRSYGAQDYGDQAGGEFGGGGGGYGGRDADDSLYAAPAKQKERSSEKRIDRNEKSTPAGSAADQEQTSWAMRIAVKSSPARNEGGQARSRVPAAESEKAEKVEGTEKGEDAKRDRNENERIRVLFYFRPAQGK
ncbi:MAG: hypothetical protein RH917_19050 [Lacipirellulaceae bacterium]